MWAYTILPSRALYCRLLFWGNCLLFLTLLAAFGPLGIQQHGLDNPEPIGAFLNGNFPSQTPSSTTSWSVENAFPNLTFVDPVQMLELTGSNRMLVAGKKGKIWTFVKESSVNSKQVLVNIESQVKTSGDEGLLGVALHPEFHVSGSPNEGYFYVWYRYTPNQSINSKAYCRLSRFRMTPGTFVAPAASEYVMIQQYDRHEWHNGGGLFFGPDSLLYITSGDEGGANDVYNSGQKLNLGLLAGVLRIDVDQKPSRGYPIIRQPQNPATPPSGWPNSFSQGYYIPFGNPWADMTGTVLEEFFALGLRSPHRMTYDPVADEIYIGDIGQGTREEISKVALADNLQWPYKEGFINGPKSMPNPLIGNDRAPFYDYPRSQGNCVIGGFVYRGQKWATSLGGLYLFGDHGTRNVWTLDPNSSNPTENFVVNVPAGGVGGKSGISSFATDSVGEVYILKLYGTNLDGGIIYKLKANGSFPEPPAQLSLTGAFQNLSSLDPVAGMLPYDLQVPFWSDGAAKYRWMCIPNNGSHNTPAEQIGYSETGEWQFPKGAVMVKHFELPIDESNATLTRRLETRFLILGNDDKYYGVTYRWREDQTDADLLSSGRVDTLSVSTPNGPREITWLYPDRQQCLSCHNEAAGGVLGPKTRQLNKDYFYPQTSRTGNQLVTLEYLNIFSPDADTSNLGSLLTSAPSQDLTKPLELRARSYLDANCASCHRPGNAIQAHFDARLSTPLGSQQILYGNLYSSLGLTGMREVVPQDLTHSMMYLRLSQVHESFSMPPLAKNKADSIGIQLIGDWIESLDPAASGTSPVMVADYSDDFQGPTPASGWSYLWNSSGAIGQATHYINLLWNGSYYDSDGSNNPLPDATNLAWGHLNSGGGHTGPSLGQGQSHNRWVIAAYTVSQAGDYAIVNSLAEDGNSGCGDGAEVAVYVNNTLIGNPSYPNGGSTTFDFSLGSLQIGDVIYVATGPGDSHDYCDSFNWDFSIQFSQGLPGQRISFPALPHKWTTDPPFTLTASASSALPVSYQVISGPASLNGNQLTLTGQAGKIIVRATQAGNAAFDAAPPVDQTFWVRPAGSGLGTGLLGTYFNELNLVQPLFARLDSQVNFYWGSGSPDPTMDYQTFSIVWEGEIEVPFSETFTFTTTTDDGVRLWIDDQLILDHWQDQEATAHSASAALTAWTKVPIKLEYYENGVYASAKLAWSSPSLPLELVPSLFLYPDDASSFPVEWLSFTAKPVLDQVDLAWETGSEFQSDYFGVERSADGTLFAEIDQVSAAGLSRQIRRYQAVDHAPLSGTSFYRLRQVDLDGSSSYSETVEIFRPMETLRVFPNPLSVSQQLSIQADLLQYQSVEIRITDLRGNLLSQQWVAAESGQNLWTLDLKAAPGLYLVQISTDQSQWTEKILLR